MKSDKNNKLLSLTESKVPELTLLFWVIKIASTTLGETGGDAVSMSMDLGYLVSTGIFALIFICFAFIQVKTKRFYPFIYWSTIIATTTVGTTLADFATRSLGVGYLGGSAILLAFLIILLLVWYKTLGTLSVSSISNPKAESFYWVTIMFSQTLGTAVGDWTADSLGFGYGGGALIFSFLLAIIISLYFWTQTSRTVLFWSAFILTRPLGAVVGDFLDKPIAKGGLALDRYTASLVLLILIVVALFIFPQRATKKMH